MRLSLITLGIFAYLLAAVVASWSKEDQEIFRVRAELEAAEGPEISFYDFIGVEKGASIDDIKKAYRKKSRVLHPDKVKQQFIANESTGKGKKKGGKPGVHVSKGPSEKQVKAATKAASDRFTRLGLVNRILQDERRDRYDHFLANGFPKWRDTGYYYERFRPGLGLVLVGLFVFAGGVVHYGLLQANWKRNQEFMQRYISRARREAWGDNLGISTAIDSGSGTATPPVAAGDDNTPQAMNRRQRRMQEKDSKKEKSEKKTKGIKAAKASPAGTPPGGATGPKKRVVAENGKILVVDMVGNVYLEEEDEDGVKQEYLLDPTEIAKPTIKDTALVQVPLWAYNKTVGHLLNKAPVDEEVEEVEDDAEAEAVSNSSSGADDFEVLEKVKTTAQNGNGKAIKRKKSGRK